MTKTNETTSASFPATTLTSLRDDARRLKQLFTGSSSVAAKAVRSLIKGYPKLHKEALALQLDACEWIEQESGVGARQIAAFVVACQLPNGSWDHQALLKLVVRNGKSRRYQALVDECHTLAPVVHASMLADVPEPTITDLEASRRQAWDDLVDMGVVEHDPSLLKLSSTDKALNNMAEQYNMEVAGSAPLTMPKADPFGVREAAKVARARALLADSQKVESLARQAGMSPKAIEASPLRAQVEAARQDAINGTKTRTSSSRSGPSAKELIMLISAANGSKPAGIMAWSKSQLVQLHEAMNNGSTYLAFAEANSPKFGGNGGAGRVTTAKDPVAALEARIAAASKRVAKAQDARLELEQALHALLQSASSAS